MHLGLIMDGNGRWATNRSLPRVAGHLEGLKACKRVAEAAIAHNIDYLTLYVFSTENWKRPQQEVSYLMGLLEKKLPGELGFFMDRSIRLLVRGDVSALPDGARRAVLDAVERTSSCSRLTIVLAVNYGGQDEIARAVNRFIASNPGKSITTADIRANLDNPTVPEPDLIARSAGEKRLSNFMLWDSAYAEFLSVPDLWPDWGESQIVTCLEALAGRTRKYGGLNS